VEIGSEIYSYLLSYAGSFERYTPYRVEMGFRSSYSLSDDYEESIDRRYCRLRLTNPFRRVFTGDPLHFSHPVEKALEWVKYETEFEDNVKFKEKRAEVLEYLEPQYQCIMTASTNIREFIHNS
jgi:hypothetical protein